MMFGYLLFTGQVPDDVFVLGGILVIGFFVYAGVLVLYETIQQWRSKCQAK